MGFIFAGEAFTPFHSLGGSSGETGAGGSIPSCCSPARGLPAEGLGREVLISQVGETEQEEIDQSTEP